MVFKIVEKGFMITFFPPIPRIHSASGFMMRNSQFGRQIPLKVISYTMTKQLLVELTTSPSLITVLSFLSLESQV